MIVGPETAAAHFFSNYKRVAEHAQPPVEQKMTTAKKEDIRLTNEDQLLHPETGLPPTQR